MIQLSASKMGILRECPRCFYDANVLGIARPRGIFSSLPNGIDLRMKGYFNQFRGSLPPELVGKVDGTLMQNLNLLTKWRSWRTGLTWEDETLRAKLIGALDDCLVTGEGYYIPLDYKTKGSEPKDDGSQYYQLQLDCYTLMLQANGYKISNKAYLVYFYPIEIVPAVGPETEVVKIMLPFGIKVYSLVCDPARAIETIKKAVEILEGKRPDPATECEHCKFGLTYPREGE